MDKRRGEKSVADVELASLRSKDNGVHNSGFDSENEIKEDREKKTTEQCVELMKNEATKRHEDAEDGVWYPIITKTALKSIEDQEEEESREKLLQLIEESVIGKNAEFQTPYGRRKSLYCDYTASGKPLKFIEDFIQKHVYPFYANTHTTTSITGLQTTSFREESREIIKQCVNASKDDVVIFCGSGVTSCVHKLIHVLELKGPHPENTVVITGPFEHHSNILPWRECGVITDRIKETFHGQLDVDDLEKKLKKYRNAKKKIIVAMSAASNVTGIKTDTDEVAEITHRYGGISIWDYAAGAPYLNMDMNRSENGYKDAILVSPHKFVGGPGSPGVLIAKRHLFRNPVPGNVGGGTVDFVTRHTQKYTENLEQREEGGTPAIIESIRAGLAFQLKQAVGVNWIEKKETQLCQRAFTAWRSNSNIIILGSRQSPRIPIFSFLVKNPESGKLLHHNFVAAVLNDVYGIQARSGCACAGPYAQDLLTMTEDLAQKYAWFFTEGAEIENDDRPGEKIKLEVLKPGFTRLNLPFFFDQTMIDFVLHAVDVVATHGWKLLPWYVFSPESGVWRNRSGMKGPNIKSLHNISYSNGSMEFHNKSSLYEGGKIDLATVTEEAMAIFTTAEQAAKKMHVDGEDMILHEEEENKLIWFLQPKQAYQFLRIPSLRLIASDYRPVAFKARNNTWGKAHFAWQKFVDKLKDKTDETL